MHKSIFKKIIISITAVVIIISVAAFIKLAYYEYLRAFN